MAMFNDDDDDRVCVCRCVCVGPAEGVLGEGQGCVYNVNTVKATDTNGRGKERRAPSGAVYPLRTGLSLLLLQSENKEMKVYRL